MRHAGLTHVGVDVGASTCGRMASIVWEPLLPIMRHESAPKGHLKGQSGTPVSQ